MNKKKKTKKREIIQEGTTIIRKRIDLLSNLAYIEKNAIELMQNPLGDVLTKAEAIKLTVLEIVSRLGLANKYEKEINKLCLPKIPFPTVGQIWRSMDQREPHRGNLKIEATIVIREGDITIKNYAIMKNLKTGKRSKIRLDRLKPGSTGFKLVRKAKGKK